RRHGLLKFEFVAPRSPEDAVAQLHQNGPGGKVVAGGTDLLPQIKARVVRPRFVVDLSQLGDLARVEQRPNGEFFLGAMARMRALQLSPLLQERLSILVDGAKLVGSL